MPKLSPWDGSQDVTMASAGRQELIDQTLFCTPHPLAASTVYRQGNRNALPSTQSTGSFLDDVSRLSLQSVSAMDLTRQLRQMNITGLEQTSASASTSSRTLQPAEDSKPDLIQFSAATGVGTGEQENNDNNDSTASIESRSSMGLIPAEMLNDCDLLSTVSNPELSASMLPLSTPKADPGSRTRSKESDASHSTFKERTGDSRDWSDNSKQDSKDVPWMRSHLDTVRKQQPQDSDVSKEDPPMRLAARGAAALFGGALGNLEEGEELEHSVHHVELADEDLKQLDADVNFSDLEEDPLSLEDAAAESGDEDFDFDEPMLGLPRQDRVPSRQEFLDGQQDVDAPQESLGRQRQLSREGFEGGRDRLLSREEFRSCQDQLSSREEFRSCQDQLVSREGFGSSQDPFFRSRDGFGSKQDQFAGSEDCDSRLGTVENQRDVAAEKVQGAESPEAESRVGEGEESRQQDDWRKCSGSSGADCGNLRKAPMSFAGDGEDAEISSSRNASLAIGQQRGAAEGEPLLSKLRRQYMKGDGSENEIDTDEELEAARQTLSAGVRERGQGADEEDTDRSHLPSPVGLDDCETSERLQVRSQHKPPDSESRAFLTTRPSAEGNPCGLPLTRDGGEGGDGSSGGDSDSGSQQTDTQDSRPAFRIVSGASGNTDTDNDNKDQSLASSVPLNSSHHWSLQGGLLPKFFQPGSLSGSSLHQDSEVISPNPLEDSTFRVEDILSSTTKDGARAEGPVKTTAHGLRFEATEFSALDATGNPFEGQFGGSLGSFGLGPDGDGGDVSAASLDRGTEEKSKSLLQQSEQPVTSGSKNATFSRPQAKDKASFDGPFRKPCAPAPLTKPAKDPEMSELELQLQELGIDIDDFKTADAAVSMLDEDEKKFEEENKFSQHHQLALAAESLAWDADDMSGYLGGEEKAEHLEMTIGAYMAARTETLGTLGGDATAPRPEFGTEVKSPQRQLPVKRMSPPSNSTTFLDSQMEEEEDEDGDQTLVSGDSTQLNDASTTPLKSPSGDPSFQAATPTTQDICRSQRRFPKSAALEASHHAELSSLLLDLTQGRADLTAEDVLSMSAVTDFIKNHSFTKSQDFVSAIVKMSQKQSEQSNFLPAKNEQSQRAAVKSPVSKTACSVASDKDSFQSLKSTPAVSSSYSSTSSSSSFKSPAQRSSRLPVRVNTNSSSLDSGTVQRAKQAVKTDSALLKRKSHSTSQLGAGPLSITENVTRSLDDSVLPAASRNEQVDVNRKSSDKGKSDASKVIFDERCSGAAVSTSASDNQSSVSRETSTQDKPQLESVDAEGNAASRTQGRVDHAGHSVHHPPDVPVNIPPNTQNQSAAADKSVKRASTLPSDNKAEKDSRPTPINQDVKRQSQNVLLQHQSGVQRVGNVPDMQTPPQRLEAESQRSHSQFPDGNQRAPIRDDAVNTEQHKQRAPDMEETANSRSVSRDDDWRELSPFDSLSVQQLSGRADQEWRGGSHFSETRVSKPTLLTTSSLLHTPFAHQYLGPPANTSQPTLHPPHSLPSHLVPPGERVRVLGEDAGGFAAQQPPSHPSRLNESEMSEYFELNEDLQQSVVGVGMGVGVSESMVQASFWGRSPVHQSTPFTPFYQDGRPLAGGGMVASRLHQTDVSHSGVMATPRLQRQLIDVPRCLEFPEFCCLGVSQKTHLPVANKTAFGLTCRFRYARLLHNGKALKQEQLCPFQIKPKISIGPGTSEIVPVLFVPKQPGEHVCHLEVFCQSLNPHLESVSSIVQLHAVAEVPCLQISPSAELLQLGEVVWGGSVTQIIKLRNVRKAALPIRLSIWSSNSVWHCFTFEGSDVSPDMSLISMSSRPESLGRNVTALVLPGCDSPGLAQTVEVKVHCRPPKKELNRALAKRAAQRVEARVEVEVDTPVQYLPSLESKLLQATVGMPRLLMAPKHMSLSFHTEPHKTLQETIVLNNAGNISMTAVLSVTAYPDCFTASPPRLTIPPGGSAEVQVLFSPLEPDLHRYQSLLLVDVEPEGPSYEIPLEGEVRRVPAPPDAPLSIMSSKSYLAFCGVPLNTCKSLTVRLFNKDSSKSEYASLEIRQQADCFKLLSLSGENQQKCEIAVAPKEKVSLTVSFCPSAVLGYSGKLIIRKQGVRSSKYSIPLSGYGGGSSLTLSGACLTNSGQRWLELGPLTLGRNIMREIILTNTGVRAAFVRATAFYDMPCTQAVHPGRVAVEPNNFVLAAGATTKVMVAIGPTSREVELVEERKEVVAVVRFQHGDEVMRQKYQRACAREGVNQQHSWQAAFRQQFINDVQDSVALEGHSIPDSPDDATAFLHHLASVCVALLAEPGVRDNSQAPSSLRSPQSADSSATVPTRDKSCLRVKEDSGQATNKDQLHVTFSDSQALDKDWTVKPDFLSFTVGEHNEKKLQIINFSRQPLSFELSWPPSCVVPEPQKGELKPRSVTGVDVWLHMAWQKRLSDLPWRGELVIACNGLKKKVLVHIQNSTKETSLPPALASPRPMSSDAVHPASREVGAGASGAAPLSAARTALKMASPNIHFTCATLNVQQESSLELSNVSADPLHWKITAFAPPYVKGADQSNSVQRVSYPVFSLPLCQADLLPNESCKVPVRFVPRTNGEFNQHWEVEYRPLPTGKLAAHHCFTARFTLTAQVTAATRVTDRGDSGDSHRKLDSGEARGKRPVWEVTSPEKTPLTSTMRLPLQEKHSNTNAGNRVSARPVPDLQLMVREVLFSATKVGHMSQVKVEFKNTLEHPVELQVQPPRTPFRIKHKTFKISKQRFLKYPIEFSPCSTGTFTDILLFRAPQLDKTFTVDLKGTGV